MVNQRIQDFLQSCGLEPGDMPKAVGAMMLVKYASLASGVAIGIRYQPLRRIVYAKGMVLQNNFLLRQKQLRFQELIDRASKYPQMQPRRAFQKPKQVRTSETLHRASRTANGGFSRPWAQQHRTRVMEAFDRARRFPERQSVDHVGSAKSTQMPARSAESAFRDARKRWKDVGQKLWLHKHRLQQQYHLVKRAQQSWRGWLSMKYWRAADALEAMVENSPFFSRVSTRLGLRPNALAVGTAEGILLSKFAMPLTAPLTLLFIVHFFRRPNALTLPSICAHVDEETEQ